MFMNSRGPWLDDRKLSCQITCPAIIYPYARSLTKRVFSGQNCFSPGPRPILYHILHLNLYHTINLEKNSKYRAFYLLTCIASSVTLAESIHMIFTCMTPSPWSMLSDCQTLQILLIILAFETSLPGILSLV